MHVHRLSDASGEMQQTLEAQGQLDRGMLDPKDVFILDTGKEVFVWVGNETSPAEGRNAMPYAHVSYIKLHLNGFHKSTVKVSSS